MRVPATSQRNLLAEQATEAHSRLLSQDGGKARDYLKARGLYKAAAERFQLGYDGDRITIPYLTPAGPWHVKRRCIADHDCKAVDCRKYLNTEGAEQHLYNAQALLDADTVVVVEGELDTISVEMAGVPAVGFPGADTWKKLKHFRWCFDSVNEVIVVADGDKVGREAGKAVTDSLRTSLPDVEVRFVSMPDGHDSNSYILAEGDVAFLSLIGLL